MGLGILPLNVKTMFESNPLTIPNRSKDIGSDRAAIVVKLLLTIEFNAAIVIHILAQ